MNTETDGRLLIGALAKAAEVGVETIRFYEREGLLPAPRRSAAGYRLYDVEAVRRLRFILRAKDLGFTLTETKELLELRVAPGACDDVAVQARAKLTSVEARIQQLERVQAVLLELLGACAKCRPTDACPILMALDD
ncbi:MAG: MerR family transcriptional regulator [Gemmatimonadales bacterium]